MLQIIITALLSFPVLGYVLYKLLHKTKPKAIEEVTDPNTGRKRIRILEGEFERGVHDNLYLFSDALVSNIVFVESLVPLEKEDLVKALFSLAKVHPLLRMKCEWEHNNRYHTEIIQFSQRDILYSEDNTEDWVERFEKELQQGYDLARGPLWRVVKIKEEFDSSSEKYTTILLLSFHHSISDGLSIMKFLDKLLKILDQIHLKTFMPENLEPMPLLPPLLELIKHKTQMSWWKRIAFKANDILSSFRGGQNSFLDLFPPPLVQNPTMTPKTCVIPGSLTKAQTTVLVQNCKSNKCTVTGALGACFAVAIAKMVDEIGADPIDINLGFPAKIRDGCRPVVSDDSFGLYIGIISFCITQPTTTSQNPFFWDLARKVSSSAREQINANKQYGYCTLLEHGLISSVQNQRKAKNDVKYAGRYPLFEISNRGNFVNEKQKSFIARRVHTAVSQKDMGPMITVSSLSINGQLHWSVVYSNKAIHKKHASEFTQHFRQAMINLSGLPA